MRKISEKSFLGYIESMCDQKRTFMIDSKRKFKGLVLGKNFIVYNKKEKGTEKRKPLPKGTKSIFGQVAKAINKFIVESDFTIEKIEQQYPSRHINRKKYRELPDGSKFYYVDISHCYWRIAFLKGYIHEKLYLSVLAKPQFKVYRNMSLSLIIAPNKREYYIRGVKSHEISEDKTLHQTIYDNIRFTAWNTMGGIYKEIMKDAIGYNVDALMVEESVLEQVKSLIEQAGFMYTVSECFKIDEVKYQNGEKEKKM